MKTIVLVLFLTLIFSFFAQETVPEIKNKGVSSDISKLSLQERKAHYEKIIMEKHGGFVNVRGTPSGTILVVNAQKKVSLDNFNITKQKSFLRLASVVKLIEGGSVTLATAAKMKNDSKADFAVFIVDDKSLPPSLIAPEEKWGIMNVAALELNAKTPEVVRIRARNEFARVFAMTCGGFSSQFKAPLTNYVKDVSDLDNCLADLPVDVSARVMTYLGFCNVKPEQKVTYRRACQQGWAAQPTNDFQKAVWKEVHEIPSEPIRIQKKK